MLDSTDKDNVSTSDSTGKDNVSILDSTDKDTVSMTNDLKSDETGISTPQSEVMMASFRIDRQLWAKFGAIAKRERLTATDVLTDYIQRCTDKDKTDYAVSIDNDATISTDTYDTDKLNDAVRMAISSCTERIDFKLKEHDIRIDANTQMGNAANTDIASLLKSVDDLTAEVARLKKSDAIG
jgi:hypothetical protein